MSISSDSFQIKWYKSDIESRIGFEGGRFTSVNNLFVMLIGLFLTVCFYAALIPFEGSFFADIFTKRGPTQHATTFLTFWSTAILFMKWRKLANQRRRKS